MSEILGFLRWYVVNFKYITKVINTTNILVEIVFIINSALMDLAYYQKTPLRLVVCVYVIILY